MPEVSPIIADCRDCWRTFLWSEDGGVGLLDEHPHGTRTGHEVAYEAAADRMRGGSA